MTNNDARIGFIGGGNMAHAIVGGLLTHGHRPDLIIVSDPESRALEAMTSLNPGIVTTRDNARVVAQADALVVAVKPQFMADALMPLGGAQMPADQLVVSVAAGVSIGALARLIKPARPIVRVMPNQPALVGAGMSVMTAADDLSAAHRDLAHYICTATGAAAWIGEEAMMDAVTAISGSGPAYFYRLMELMEQQARALGLPAELASTLVRQTGLGAGRVAAESQLDLAVLRESVTSRGGTTAAALECFDEGGLNTIVSRALQAARDRSEQLDAEFRDRLDQTT